MKIAKILLLLFIPAVICARPNLTMQDFAYGIKLGAEKPDQLYQFYLPPEVYANTTSREIGDVRVYNSAGKMLPYSIKRSPLEKKVKTAKLAFFPIYSQKRNLNKIKLNVKTNKKGAMVAVDVNDSKFLELHKTKLIGYIIDVSKFKGKMARDLELSLRAKDQNWVQVIFLSASDDLQNWTWLSDSRSVISELEYQGNSISKNTIPLERVNSKYLFLKWKGVANDFKLTDVKLNYYTGPVAPLNWVTLTPKKIKVRGSEYFYKTKGYYPVSEVNIVPGEDDGSSYLYNAEVYSRAFREQDWHAFKNSLFYRFKSGNEELTNQPLELRYNYDQFWRVKFLNSIYQKEPINLVLGWRPDLFTFLASGNPPYTLVFGSSGLTSDEFPLSILEQGSKQTVQTIQIAENPELEVLSGEKSLREKLFTADSIQQIILWAVLIIGVLLVIWMVTKLLKQMRSEKS